MKKYLSVFCLFFVLMVGITEGAPEIQPEIVLLLKPKLNSDRIEYFFGNYGVDTLKIDSPVFLTCRIANLHSVHEKQKIMRTLAIVDFIPFVRPDLNVAHHKILEGKSIGIALREEGWIVHKAPLYFGTTLLSPQLMEWMKESSVDKAALHIYRLEVSKISESESIPYCVILEVHSPQYLTKEWLQGLYEEQFEQFSIPSEEVAPFLDRLSTLIRDFPSYES